MIGNRLIVANHKANKALDDREYWRPAGDRIRGMLRKTRCTCSCWMCGHQRKYFGLTMQERRLKLIDE